MKSCAKSVLSSLVFCLILSSMIFPQTMEKGDISGTVVDQEGSVLPGATVTLRGEKLFQSSISKVANDRGVFRFLNLTPGVYKLEVTLAGFNTLELPNIAVRGLMGMPPFGREPEESRPYFRRLRELAEEVSSLGIPNVQMRELSMGMSNDFAVAVEEGATMVRVGTALFGHRG